MENPLQQPSLLDRIVLPGTRIRCEHILWSVLFLAAVVTRFAMLDTRVMSHDEAQHTQLAWSLYSGTGYVHVPMTHGPFQIEVVASSYFLFGGSDWASRIPAALFGVAAVMLILLFRRWIGRSGALAAGLLMTISPYMVYYSRYVRNESFVVVWALLMFYAVGRYLESRESRWLYLLAVVTTLHYATKETAYIYIGLMIIFLAAHLQFRLFRERDPLEEGRRNYLVLSTIGIALALVAVVFFLAGRAAVIEAAVQAGVTPLPDQMLHTEMPITNILVLIGLAVLVAAVVLVAAAIRQLVKARPFAEWRTRYPSIDVLVVLGTLLLPQIAAFPMALFNLNPWDGDPLKRIQDLGYLAAVAACFLPGLLAAIAVGLAWDRKKWLVCAGIFFGIFIVLYTTLFTNLFGLATGMIGNVNYWMAQQGVERGGQPWYYYLFIQIPIYEYLPALLALCAPVIGWMAWRKRRSASPEGVTPVRVELAAPSGEPLPAPAEEKSPMVWLLGFWSIGSLLAYSAAGEKMPWLTVHITLPFILLGGWVLGWIMDGIKERRLFAWPGIVALLVLPATLAASLVSLDAWLAPVQPFSGNTIESISASSNFIFSLLIALAGIFLIGWLWRGVRAGVVARAVFLAGTALLAVCTLRAAWMASFINGDMAKEFLVYAHSAPGVKTVLAKVEEISRRTQDDLGIPVAYDEHVGWIMTWYLRDYPNRQNFGNTLSRKLVDVPVVMVSPGNWAAADQLLSETHQSFTYVRGWWPMMDYFNLTVDRVLNALESPAYRRGLWDIWWNRDYTAYGLASGTDFSLSHWPSAEHMRLYLRKDLAAAMWPYSSTGVLPEPVVDPYAQSLRTLTAAQAWGSAGAESGNFQKPRAVAVAPDGSVYVSDTGNNRIQHLAADGTFIKAWGSTTQLLAGVTEAQDGTFNEPWGIAVAQDGSVYVADTWNNRIQKFDKDGVFLKAWGHGGGADDVYGFYGPRAVAVDLRGRVFVVDTGNKRIMVYDTDGEFLMQIGSGGFEPGQFDEPVGMAIGPDGRLYVADTWNRRVQVFEDSGGAFLYQTEWNIDGWEGESPDIKPFLAVAPDGNVWVTDPGLARVLVFDSNGGFLFTFGQPGDDSSSFMVPTGIALGGDGTVFVADTTNNRVMVFAPQ